MITGLYATHDKNKSPENTKKNCNLIVAREEWSAGVITSLFVYLDFNLDLDVNARWFGSTQTSYDIKIKIKIIITSVRAS